MGNRVGGLIDRGLDDLVGNRVGGLIDRGLDDLVGNRVGGLILGCVIDVWVDQSTVR